MMRACVGFSLAGVLALSSLSCVRPVDCLPLGGVSDATSLLEGSWVVRAYDGRVDGEIVFDGGRVRARWDEVTLAGVWEHVDSVPNALRLRLSFGEAYEGEVLHRYGVLDVVELEVVVVGRDRVYALQQDGAWTQWDRLGRGE